jgi:hypothetical protein
MQIIKKFKELQSGKIYLKKTFFSYSYLLLARFLGLKRRLESLRNWRAHATMFSSVASLPVLPRELTPRYGYAGHISRIMSAH